MSPEERGYATIGVLASRMPEVYSAVRDYVAEMVRAAVETDRRRIADIVEHFRDLNAREDGPLYPGLSVWAGDDGCGCWTLDPDRLIELILGTATAAAGSAPPAP
jgi:hypothetical protein